MRMRARLRFSGSSNSVTGSDDTPPPTGCPGTPEQAPSNAVSSNNQSVG